MDHQEAGRFWNANAGAWTKLARAGYDVYRDFLNTPAFFDLLPNVVGLVGLDIGCGEGHNTRLLARRGARVTAIDIAEDFVAWARRPSHASRWASTTGWPAPWLSRSPTPRSTSPRRS